MHENKSPPEAEAGAGTEDGTGAVLAVGAG